MPLTIRGMIQERIGGEGMNEEWAMNAGIGPMDCQILENLAGRMVNNWSAISDGADNVKKNM